MISCEILSLSEYDKTQNVTHQLLHCMTFEARYGRVQYKATTVHSGSRIGCSSNNSHLPSNQQPVVSSQHQQLSSHFSLLLQQVAHCLYIPALLPKRVRTPYIHRLDVYAKPGGGCHSPCTNYLVPLRDAHPMLQRFPPPVKAGDAAAVTVLPVAP